MADRKRLSLRAVNRATLDRQLLLRRHEMPARQAVRHLGGLQAQAPLAPYVGLWTRLAGFTTDELSRLLSERTMARAPVIRASFIGRTGGPAIWVPAVRGTQSACRVRLASLAASAHETSA